MAHTHEIIDCPDCGGSGSVDVQAVNSPSASIWRTCETCHGSGEVKQEIETEEDAP